MIADLPEPIVFVEEDSEKDDWIFEQVSFDSFMNAKSPNRKLTWSFDDKKYTPSTQWNNIKIAVADHGAGTYEARYSYQLGKFSFGGSYLHNTNEKKISEQDSWAFGASYLGAKLSKPGSYGLYLGFRDVGAKDSLGYFSNAHGFEFGASYAFSKSVIGSFSAFHGRDSISDQKVKAERVELTIYF